MTIIRQIQTLQVFNGGKPCGWLGRSATGYWFHYSSNNPQQHWVSLMMPPCTNFYQQAELFPVFAQHLGAHTNSKADTLSQLLQLRGQQLGSLSFANPDNPVVIPPLRTPPALAPGQSVLIASQARKPFADTLVHHISARPLIQNLLHIKKQTDPTNLLHGLRWAYQAQHTEQWVEHPRPDLAPYQQHLYGFETMHVVLNQNPHQFQTMAKHGNRFAQVLQEVARTYCKNFSAEIALLQHLLPYIQQGHLNAHLVYEQTTAHSKPSRPKVLGIEYLPAPRQ